MSKSNETKVRGILSKEHFGKPRTTDMPRFCAFCGVKVHSHLDAHCRECGHDLHCIPELDPSSPMYVPGAADYKVICVLPGIPPTTV